MGIEFVTPDVFKTGTVANKGKKRETKKERPTRGLPKTLREKIHKCKVEEPHCGAPECKARVYRRLCPIEECEYLSGRYISHSSALKALLGHLRWVHNYG